MVVAKSLKLMHSPCLLSLVLRYYQRDLMDVSPSSTGSLSPSGSFDGSQSRLKRLPLCSNNQPQLFFRVPDRPAAHPQLFRNSRLIREEEFVRQTLRESGAKGLPIVGSENDVISPSRTMTLENTFSESRFASPEPSFGTERYEAASPIFRRDSPHTASLGGSTTDTLHKSLARVGIPSIRPNTSMSLSRSGTLNDVSPSKVGRDIGQERNRTPPQAYQQSAFQSHMSQARQRWQADKTAVMA
jgi:hypothetical protein